MALNLRKEDYIVILSVLVSSLLVGSLEYYLGPVGHKYIEVAGPGILLAGAYFLYRSSRSWQNSIARYLELIVIGITFFSVSWMFNIMRSDFNMIGALGATSDFWIGFFHPFAVGSVIIIVYGIFFIWREGDLQFERD